jgi:GTP cyclohydrolase I
VARVAPSPEAERSVTEQDVPDVVRPLRPAFDNERIERAVREILLAIGEDPDRDGLLETPARVARMYEEIFGGMRQNPSEYLKTTFEADHDEMVLVRDITMYSACEHHLLPWIGKAHVAYIPNDDGRVTGLSKLARLVDAYAKRPQVQERLTSQIADELARSLQPKGVMVVIEAEHLCMTMRGIRKPGAVTVTSAVRGQFRESVATREEAMRFIQGR